MKKSGKITLVGKQGKFIAIYGINGIGKTTQANLLVQYLRKKGKRSVKLKYPIYNLEPEGPFIYKYLRDPKFRGKNELTTHELQKKYAQNRMRYEPILCRRLKMGEWIVAEDYRGTGIAWGLAWGGDLDYLENINKNLLDPDLEVLMHGERFLSAVEENHRNEINSERIAICKNFHYLLADRYKWIKINAEQKVNKVHADIVERIKILL